MHYRCERLVATSSPTTFGGYRTVHLKPASEHGILLVESGNHGSISQIITDDNGSTIGARSNHQLRLTTNDTVRMNIDSSGHVTMPNQPAFNIVGNQGTYPSRITAGGTTNAIPFNLARGQGTSGFNTSNGVFTAPVAGSYLFTLYTLVSSAANHESYMYKNGTLYARVYNEGGRGNSFSSIIPMAVNDYIVFGCDQNVYLQNTTANYSSASIALLG